MRNHSSLAPTSLLWLIAIVGLYMGIRIQFLGIPFERDEGAYALYGWQLLNGAVPYQDFHAMKWPFLFYSYAGILGLFGATIKGLQLGFLLITTSNLLWLYAIVKRLYPVRYALLSMAVFALLQLHPQMYGVFNQSEHLIVFLLLAGAYVVMVADASQKPWGWWIAGILLALAFQIKQSSALIIFLIGLWSIRSVWQATDGWKRGLANGAQLVGGVALCLLIFLWLMYRMGVWEDFLFWTFEFPGIYLQAISFGDSIDNLVSMVQSITYAYWGIFLLAAIGFLQWFVAAIRFRSSEGIAGVLAFLISMAVILPGWRYYGHYWLMWNPVLAVAAGVGGFVLWERWLGSSKGKIAGVTFGLVAVLLPVVLYAGFWFSKDYTEQLRTSFTYNPFPEIYDIAVALQPLIQPGDKTLVFGAEPQFYFYTRTLPPTSFSYFSHIVKDVPESKAWNEVFRQEVLEDLPRFVLFLSHPASWDADKQPANEMTQWVNEELNIHYQQIGFVDILPGRSKYLWNEQALQYKPTSSIYIYIMQRRN